MYALVLTSILYVKRFRIMSTTFGVHIGNTSACIAVSKEGKTDVVANDAGDRWDKYDNWYFTEYLLDNFFTR